MKTMETLVINGDEYELVDGKVRKTIDEQVILDEGPAFVKRWKEHGGPEIVTRSLIETITNYIRNDKVLNGEFTFFNITYSDGFVGCGSYGLVKYRKHLDNYVTVTMTTENIGTEEYVARFVVGESIWNIDWLKFLKSSHIANNLATTESGYLLDARQGKNLYDKMNNMKPASFTARGSNTAFGLSVDTPTKVKLDTAALNTTGCRPSGASHSFELTSDGGIKCPYTGTILVSGSAFITGDNTNDIVNKGCTVRRKTVQSGGEYGPETDVCAQFIRDVGVGGGISAGTIAVNVQDGDVFYLYARSSGTAKCDATNAATYLSLTYLSVG